MKVDSDELCPQCGRFEKLDTWVGDPDRGDIIHCQYADCGWWRPMTEEERERYV